MNGNVIRTITIRGTSEGLDKLQTDLTKLAAAHKDVAIAAEQTDKRTLSLEQAWKRQTLRLDEAARAQANIARETKLADAALREGLATQAQHAQRLELINQRYTTTPTAPDLRQGAAAGHRRDAAGAARTDQPVAGKSRTSASASRPGNRRSPCWCSRARRSPTCSRSSGGTLRGFFSQAMGWAGRFLSSWAGIATAVAAVGAAAVYVAMQFRTASTTIEEALEDRIACSRKASADRCKASAEQKATAQSSGSSTALLGIAGAEAATRLPDGKSAERSEATSASTADARAGDDRHKLPARWARQPTGTGA